jgi:hypothetical protein
MGEEKERPDNDGKTDYDATAAYEEFIRPQFEKLHQLCIEHDVPVVASVFMKKSGDEVYQAFCAYATKERCLGKQLAAINLLDEKTDEQKKEDAFLRELLSALFSRQARAEPPVTH